MRKLICVLLCVVFLLSSCNRMPYVPHSNEIKDPFDSPVEYLRDNNVRLESPLGGHGSGVLMGTFYGMMVILTAAHVAKIGPLIAKTKCGGRAEEFHTVPLSIDLTRDLAVMVSDGDYHGSCDPGLRISKQTPYITQMIMVIGDPVRGEGNVTIGRIVNNAVPYIPEWPFGPSLDSYSIDAHIGPGNSGGGVYNMDGELIGIIVASYWPGMLAQGVVIPLKEIIIFLHETNEFSRIF